MCDMAKLNACTLACYIVCGSEIKYSRETVLLDGRVSLCVCVFLYHRTPCALSPSRVRVCLCVYVVVCEAGSWRSD